MNVTPDQCSVEIDVRLRPGTTPDDILCLLAAPGMDVEILDFKPAVETAIDHPFARTCSDACAIENGREPGISGVAYYSDATIYTAAYGTPFVIVGPGELGMSGQPDEFVETENVQRAIRIFKRIAENWLRV